MSKFTYTPLTTLANESSAIERINANFASLQGIIQTVLSRDGTSPNTMTSTLDMNSNRVVNLPIPFNDTEPLRLKDLRDYVAGIGKNPVIDIEVNPKTFGAVGDGVTDDSNAVQAAIDYASLVGAPVVFPAGVYHLTKTLVVHPSMTITTRSPREHAILHRIGNYGDTIVFGSSGSPAMATTVSGIWFIHGPLNVAAQTPGQTSLDHQITDGQSAHLRINGGQGVIIQDCIFWRMPSAITFEGGSILRVERNTFIQVWDHVNSGAQEGVASVWARYTSPYGNPKDIFLSKNEFLGAWSDSRTATLPDSSTHTMAEFVGPQFTVFLQAGETCYLHDNYFGNGNVSNVYLNPSGGGYVANVTIHGNFFDGARLRQIQVTRASIAVSPVVNLNITGNIFNGEYATWQHIFITVSDTDNLPSAFNATITGNTFNASYGSAMALLGLVGCMVTGNQITSYNAFNRSMSDAMYCSAIYIDSYSAQILTTGNFMGGGGNYYDPAITGGNYSYEGVTILDSLSTGSTSTCTENNNVFITPV